jgi:hypothetical protein
MSAVVRRMVKMAKQRNNISKEELKEADPDLYNELYGKGSENYEAEKIKKETKKEFNQD